VIFVARKGQKFKTYSFELKKKAVEMRLQGIPTAKIAEELGIQDVGRLKIWMRKYREQGDFGLMEHRGRRKEYKDLERGVKRLRPENDVLKKWLEILARGGKHRGVKWWMGCVTGTASRIRASFWGFPEAAITGI